MNPSDSIWSFAVRFRNFAKKRGLIGPIETPLVRLATRLIAAPSSDAEVRLPSGMIMTIPAGYPASRTYAAGLYEPEVTRLVRSLLSAGMTVVDAGASVGYYTLISSGLVGPTGYVYSFEPDAISFACLARNLQTNLVANAKAVNMALSTTDGLVRFVRDPAGAESFVDGKDNSGVGIPATSLDSFFSMRGWPRVDLVKMDIEGGERGALDGMRELSRRNANLQLIIEINDQAMARSGTTSAEMSRLFLQLGFAGARIIEGDAKMFPIAAGLGRHAGTYNLHVTKE